MNAPEDIDVENLKNEVLKLKEENEKLKKKIDDLNKEVIVFYNIFLLLISIILDFYIFILLKILLI